MVRPILKEGFTEFEIVINPDLKFARAETWKHGIKRYWGFDPIDKSQKLIYVQYPKSKYSRSDMVRILPKYSNCRLCKISSSPKKLIKGKNNNTIMDYSIISNLGKIPAIGSYITRNRDITEPVVMQTLSTITRYPLSILNTELGKRLFSLLIGLGGLAVVNYAIKSGTLKGEWANFFANYISSAAEMEAQKGTLSLGVREDLRRLKNSIKAGNFSGIAYSLLNDPAHIQRTIKNIQSSFSNAFHLPRGGRRLRPTENTMPTIKKLFGSGKSGDFEVKYADDYKYTDTSKRFKDISAFGSGFRKERRFRESGDAVYHN